MCLRFATLSIAGFFWLFALAPATAEPARLAAAIEANDAQVLTAAADGADETLLAQGVLAAWRGEDEAAAHDLQAAANGHLPPTLRRSALLALAGVRFRQGLFADAADATEAAQALGAEAEPAREAAITQSRVFARALSGVTPMTWTVAEAGTVRIERDLAQLARADVAINSAPQQAVLDTGAGYSTIAQSAAERLGLRFLDAEVTVGSVSAEAVAARLAIADRLTLAGGEFRDVVFIVMPDAALTFAGGAYRIEAIVGLPVLRRLGRLEFARSEDGERLQHMRSPHQRGPESNMSLDGLRPVARISANGAQLSMLLDTGARRSALYQRAAQAHPQLVAESETRQTRIGGAGGEVTQDALSIPRLALDVAGAEVALEDVSVLPNARGDDDGVVGQDVMRAGRGYAIDFDAMRFELLDAG